MADAIAPDRFNPLMVAAGQVRPVLAPNRYSANIFISEVVQPNGRISMQTNVLFPAALTPRIHGIFRIIVGFLFLQHGTAKLLSMPHVAMFDHLQLFSLLGLAGILELFGGILVLIGLFTRPIAFILSGEMAFAYFIAHAPKGFLPILNGGELAVFYCFAFLFFAFAGAGALSIDAARSTHNPLMASNAESARASS